MYSWLCGEGLLWDHPFGTKLRNMSNMRSLICMLLVFASRLDIVSHFLASKPNGVLFWRKITSVEPTVRDRLSFNLAVLALQSYILSFTFVKCNAEDRRRLGIESECPFLCGDSAFSMKWYYLCFAPIPLNWCRHLRYWKLPSEFKWQGTTS